MSGAGRFEPRAAGDVLRQWDELRASVVRWQIAQILDVIDQRIERRLSETQPFNAAAGHRGKRDIASLPGEPREIAIEDGEASTDEGAKAPDLDLDKIEAILDPRNALAHIQSVSPFVESEHETIPARSAPESKKGAGK